MEKKLIAPHTPGPIESQKQERPSFEDWMKAVDEWVWLFVGCSVYDLPDQLYRDWYDARWSPKDAASSAVAQAGFGG